MKAFISILLTYFLVLIGSTAHGTHIRAGEIRSERLSCTGLSYKITLIIYTNTASPTHPGGWSGGGTLSWSEGSMRVPQITNVTLVNSTLKIGMVTFTKEVLFSREGTFTISYEESHRNVSTLNIPNSRDDIDFFVENQLIVSASLCDSSPSFLIPPVDQACRGIAFFHNPGASDPDGDSLSYSLTIPKGNNGVTISGYENPNHSKFYTGLNYQQANMTKNGPPAFGIHATSGLLTWDAPGAIGAYNIAIKVTQWKKNPVDSTWQQFGYVIRDMQIEVLDCKNRPPSITSVQDVCVLAGELVSLNAKGKDLDFDNVIIEVFTDIVSFKESAASVKYTGVIQSTLPDTAHVEINWRPDCSRVREQSYTVVLKITDNPIEGPKLVNFKVWNIKVVAPAPVWKKSTLDLVKRYTELEWDSYACANANKIQVWRKVDSYSYTPGRCEPGLPKFLGYSLLAEKAMGQTSFIDTNYGRGLVVGATYCYRIMAYFNSPASTPSLVSIEKCVGPIEADAPVITHVSVENTSVEEGKIRVSWRSPFNINTTQFPKPYEYEVYRAQGFIGDSSLTKAGRVQDTTFVDTNINSKGKKFNYRVVLYSKPQNATSIVPVDTSAIASSERLSVVPGEKQIGLVWRDSVPWSNVAQNRPYHLIYRGVENDYTDKMILIDSVNVAVNGFAYLDKGRYNNEPIRDDKRYSYRIVTRGTYGNPKISLQQNYSQVITTYPISKLVPCEQTLHINSIKCDEYWNNRNCDQKEFSNTISWGIKDLSGCRRDIKAFTIYSASTSDGEYSLLAASVTDTVYVDKGLPSFSRCYRVSALDRLGIEGPLSDSVCNDNCPYYILPNVFTPNADGFNDSFNANFDRFLNGEITTEGSIRCPRFVLEVNLKIYNRWGNEVYHYKSNDGGSIAIEWDGKDTNGHELATGVYFYSAKVTFNVMDPTQQIQEIKGWVQLVR